MFLKWSSIYEILLRQIHIKHSFNSVALHCVLKLIYYIYIGLPFSAQLLYFILYCTLSRKINDAPWQRNSWSVNMLNNFGLLGFGFILNISTFFFLIRLSFSLTTPLSFSGRETWLEETVTHVFSQLGGQ